MYCGTLHTINVKTKIEIAVVMNIAMAQTNAWPPNFSVDRCALFRFSGVIKYKWVQSVWYNLLPYLFEYYV